MSSASFNERERERGNGGDDGDDDAGVLAWTVRAQPATGL